MGLSAKSHKLKDSRTPRRRSKRDVTVYTEASSRQMKLAIELVPSTVWHQSLYNMMPKEEWNRLKQRLFAEEGRKCYICGSVQGPLSAHEFWEYDDEKQIQKLVAIHHLCPLCHKVKHIGFWLHTSHGSRMLNEEGLTSADIVEHFCSVNKCVEKDFLRHESEAFDIWSKRSRHEWKQSLGVYAID